MNSNDKGKSPFTPLLGVIVGAAAIMGVATSSAGAMTLDQHGRVLVDGTAVSQILPAGDHPQVGDGPNNGCNFAAGCGKSV
jgi:hypothetical protein